MPTYTAFCRYQGALLPGVYLFVLTILSLVSCQHSSGSKVTTDTVFELVPAQETGIVFQNTLKETPQLNIITYEYFYNGSGVGIGDINNDGLPDVFLGGNQTNSQLYLNKGGFRFEDITRKAGIYTADGWVTGIAMVDINADGFLDIYVCRSGPHDPAHRTNQLYINQKDNTFREQARAYGLNFAGNTTQAAFFDYDKDGDLDVYLVTNVMEPTGPNIIRPKISDGSSVTTDRLFRNNGNLTFTDVSREAGITHQGYGLGIAISDLNNDGWPDIYVSNDYLSNDLLYINQHDGTFHEKASDYLKHQSYSAMGNDAADVDNDGWVDLITVDMLPEDNGRRKLMLGSMNYDRHLTALRSGYAPQYVRNTLQHNNGNGTFSEVGRLAGVYSTDWSWSALLADYDNNGTKDLFITNGYPRDITNRDFAMYRMGAFQSDISDADYRQRLFQALQSVDGALLHNYVFAGKGDLTFTDQSTAWGMDETSYSNGAAYADLDNDGDLDLVVNNLNREAFVYRNQTCDRRDSHYLKIALHGELNNTAGLGSRVELFYQGKKQVVENSPYRGYQSSVDPVLHVGLGTTTHVDSLRITWPDGRQKVYKNIPTDQTLQFKQKDAVQVSASAQLAPVLFRKPSDGLIIPYTHLEQLYIDFKIQPLLPHLLSQQGPGVAVGDMNGDGLEDFYIGGAFRQSGHLFFQLPGDRFRDVLLTKDKKYEEDQGVLLFDADNDQDLDLYIVSGSSEFPLESEYYRDRLYVNDGKGNFTLNKNALPDLRTSGSCVQAADIDHDGDLDLFVGGRLQPTQYPMAPSSYLLLNEGGRFTNVTMQLAPELDKLGMVTTALWTDFDQDGWIDLLVAGEWMSLTLFRNTQGHLANVTASTGLPQTHGWWNSITSGDFDGDSDTDYIIGNLGQNHAFKLSVQQPLQMYAADFDHNGVVDPVMFQQKGDKLYPIHSRDEVVNQMNYLRKKFPDYRSYAQATLTDMFLPDEWTHALQLKAEVFESVYLENRGQGRFQISPLPVQAQVSPLYGMLSGDFDGDDQLDLLGIGNSYATESITGCYDASIGLFLKGNGKGHFTPVSFQKSGFWVDGDAKALVEIRVSKNKRLLMATQNNDKVKTFVIPASVLKTAFSPRLTDVWAEVIYPDGRKRRIEFYYGSGYLSQSSRIVWLAANCRLQVYNAQGQSRTVVLK